jgi:hypothetical protein
MKKMSKMGGGGKGTGGKAGLSKSPSLMSSGEKSSKMSVSAGSGAGVHKSKHPVATSAPMHPHKLSRATPGALK